MQLETSIYAIKERAGRINLPLARLAERAGMPTSTLTRPLREGGNVTVRTLGRAYEALVAEELALRDYLLRQHPLSASPVSEPAREAA
jgi:transcriptional regulator with XRE-family HTH domain